jgi:hypothetical protein
MDNTFKGIIAVLILVVAAAGGYLLYGQISEDTSFTDQKSDFTVEAEFEDGEWNYVVAGDLPNPCHTADVEVKDQDDKKIIELIVTLPEEDEVCAEVIEPVEITGAIEAESNQEFEFLVTRLRADGTRSNGLEDLQKKNAQFSSSGNFTAQAYIDGGNTWVYEVTGNLPHECFDITTEAVVAESFPEQVTIRVTSVETDPNCEQETYAYATEGTYEASPEATMSLRLFTE